MLIREDKLSEYLGNDIKYLEGKVYAKTLARLRRYNDNLCADRVEVNPPLVIDYLLLRNQRGDSINKLTRETGLDPKTFIRIFKIYRLPLVSQAEAIRRIWKDPKFVARHAEGVKQSR